MAREIPPRWHGRSAEMAREIRIGHSSYLIATPFHVANPQVHRRFTGLYTSILVRHDLDPIYLGGDGAAQRPPQRPRQPEVVEPTPWPSL